MSTTIPPGLPPIQLKPVTQPKEKNRLANIQDTVPSAGVSSTPLLVFMTIAAAAETALLSCWIGVLANTRPEKTLPINPSNNPIVVEVRPANK